MEMQNDALNGPKSKYSVSSITQIDLLKNSLSALTDEIKGLHLDATNALMFNRTVSPITHDWILHWENVRERIDTIYDSLAAELRNNLFNLDNHLSYLERVEDFLESLAVNAYTPDGKQAGEIITYYKVYDTQSTASIQLLFARFRSAYSSIRAITDVIIKKNVSGSSAAKETVLKNSGWFPRLTELLSESMTTEEDTKPTLVYITTPADKSTDDLLLNGSVPTGPPTNLDDKIPVEDDAKEKKKLPTTRKELIEKVTLIEWFEYTSKYNYIIQQLAENGFCDSVTHKWTDTGLGFKDIVAKLIKYLHTQGYYGSAPVPSTKEIQQIARNTFGVTISERTINGARVSKGSTHNLSFIGPADTAL